MDQQPAFGVSEDDHDDFDEEMHGRPSYGEQVIDDSCLCVRRPSADYRGCSYSSGGSRCQRHRWSAATAAAAASNVMREVRKQRYCLCARVF